MWKKEIIEEACQKFQGTIRSLQLLGGFYDHVYEFERNGEACVLKLYPIASKDKSQLLSELKWVSFVRSNGIETPRPILSMRGQTVETIIQLPIPCCIISTRKASGKKADPSMTEWNARLFRRWGQWMGKLHSLSPKFHEREWNPVFGDWNEGEIFHRDLTFIDRFIADRWVLLLNKIEAFPKTPQTFGLIHNDFTQNGFFITGSGNIMLYDFSKVKYHWFTYDIAVALYHALETVPEEEQENFKELFMQSFMEGYQLEHTLSDDWWEQVELFLEYRRLFLYLYLMSYLDMGRAKPETIQYVNKLKRLLLHKKPVTSYT